MRALRILAPVAVAFAFLAPALAQEKDAAEKRLFWHVASETGSVYLLGSVHVGTDDMYPLPKEIEDAYKKSDAVAVEADITASDKAKVQGIIMSKGVYGEGDSLSKHLSKDNVKKLKEFCKKEEIEYTQLKMMKPWLAAIQIEGSVMAKLNLDMALGIDKHFLDQAHDEKTKKKIIELESMEMQIDLFADLSDELQESFIMSTVNEQEKGKDGLEKMLDAWKKGDVDKIDELSHEGEKEHPEFKPLMTKLIDDRNVGMVKKIEELLAAKGTTFVTVGSGHMVGEKGIVKLLEATKKYKIDRPALTKPEKKEPKEEKKDDDGMK